MNFSKKSVFDAVTNNKSISGVARALGITGLNSKKREKIKFLIRSFDIDMSHFYYGKSKYTKDILEEACKVSFSYSEVARRIGAPKAQGSVYSHIKRQIKSFGIPVDHFNGRAWSKGKVFSNRRKKASDILIYYADERKSRVASYLLHRSLIEIGREPVCEVCSSDRKLEVDHIDGQWRNCVPSNLRFICLPCHAETPTYGSKNKVTLNKLPKKRCLGCNKIISRSALRCIPCSAQARILGIDDTLHLLKREIEVLAHLLEVDSSCSRVLIELASNKKLQEWVVKNYGK